MMYYPKVSIIIPVYNGSNFLAEAIDAALAQTYKNCEVIVINDGSTDDGASEKIAFSYGNRLRYFYKENGGVSSALNFALEKMTGEWFSWLSHDDLYYPEKIEKQIKFINELIIEDPSLDISKITVRCATESIDRDGKVIRRPSYRNVPRHEKPIDTIVNNVYNYRLSGCAFLLPATCIVDIGYFDEQIRTVSDVDYWYRLLFAGYEFYCLSNDVLVKNRSHGKQVGKTKVSLFEKELNELHIRISDRLMESKMYVTADTLIRFYLGVTYRELNDAEKYIRATYLRKYASAVTFWFVLPVLTGIQKAKGTIRRLARDIFRKIKVK